MLSINTNLSSIIAQESMKQSTNKLNQAIERMSTGYKINHAKDNAANYSISTNTTTKLNAYQIAQDNVAKGMDLVATASDTISMMQDKASRLQSLSTQARNGTYGAQSLEAMQQEASAIVLEITRLYMTSEYNKISLFNITASTIANHLPKAGESGFIDETAITTNLKTKQDGFIENPETYTEEQLESMLASGELKKLDNNVTSFTSGQKYLISDKTELERLAALVNSGKSGSGAIFILGEDIDLKNEEWTPIGTNSNPFGGTFDGNGHTIKNLKIDNSTANYQGLFGRTGTGSEIKNIGLVNCNVKGKDYVGGLVGYGEFSSITNSYATGDVTGSSNFVGGLVGSSSSSITNSYATGGVSGTNYVGGLVGNSSSSSITNSYATGDVSGTSSVGGLVGYSYSSSITNSYATGGVSGTNHVGGFVGYGESSSITNSYATGGVSGADYVGGLVGSSSSSITNSYATGDVTGSSYYVGGLVGSSSSSITNSYATGDVSGADYVGGLVGRSSSSSITNSYATGDVTGSSYYVGGLVGSSSSSITNSYATGDVSGTTRVGGLVGGASSSITNSYATGSITGENGYTGGLVGYINAIGSNVQFNKCAFYGEVNTENSKTGSFIGGIINTTDDVNFSTINISNCEVMTSDKNVIGCVLKANGSINPDYDMLDWLDEIKDVEILDISTTLQVGIYGDNSNQLNFDTNFSFDLSAINAGIGTESAFNAITEFINILSEKSTQFGAIQNRLESALESIEVNITNLASSRSTLRDADMAELSSTYIQQQILQQASATLMATANQSPAIALQLI